MNQQQRKYALSRVNGILKNKELQAKEKHTKPGVILTPQQRFAAFKNGEYKIRKDIVPKINSNTDICNVVEFDKEKPESVNSVGLALSLEKMRARAKMISDKIVLGDGKEALTLIDDFEKESF